jgi:hypothetical protein
LDTNVYWDATGHTDLTNDGKTGFWGRDIEITVLGQGGNGIEIDSPDWNAFGRDLLRWNGGSSDLGAAYFPHAAHQGNTVQDNPGNWGFLQGGGTNFHWYYNDVLDDDGTGSVGDVDPRPLIQSEHQCFGVEGTKPYPTYLASMSVWGP